VLSLIPHRHYYELTETSFCVKQYLCNRTSPGTLLFDVILQTTAMDERSAFLLNIWKVLGSELNMETG